MPLSHRDPLSGCPASKKIAVRLSPAAAPLGTPRHRDRAQRPSPLSATFIWVISCRPLHSKGCAVGSIAPERSAPSVPIEEPNRPGYRSNGR